MVTLSRDQLDMIVGHAQAQPDQEVCAGTEVHFDGSSSRDFDGVVNRFEWDFGDGVTGGGDKPVHVYQAPGDYRVRLERVDASGSVLARAESSFNAPTSMVASAADSMPTQADGPVSPPTRPRFPSVAAADSGDKTGAVVVPKIETTMVAPGDNLWRISRTTYGKGMRYPVIVRANREQIRNPALIRPGQVFVLPHVSDSEAH